MSEQVCSKSPTSAVFFTPGQGLGEKKGHQHLHARGEYRYCSAKLIRRN